MNRINLLGTTVSEMENIMADLGEKRFKGRQLFKWLYNSMQPDFTWMTNLSVALRQKLAGKYTFTFPRLEKLSKSKDGTEKSLLALDDGLFIETVLIPDGLKRTVCVSSQAGCPLGCKFCATGLIGFKRNLTVGEIIGQLIHLRREHGNDSFHNIVFMGMGEPLLNYDNMLKAVGIISSEIGLSLSAHRITVSTVGIVPRIYTLADSGIKVNLAISLHAATDEKRKRLMPVARLYNLTELMSAARYFAVKRKKRITFEYILFEGFNDSPSDVRALADLVRGIPCKINILAYNPVGILPFHRPLDDKVNEFAKLLYPRAPAVTVRKSRGLDIEAACGQLAGKHQKL
jgi:23S rRNA (adenine2503-C2)-methyltransferase